MNLRLCPIRKTTIVQVTRPPLGLWRFHWHELLPIARARNGNGSVPVYLPEIEPQDGRSELISRLRAALVDRTFETGRLALDGCTVEVLEGDRTGLLPDFQEADLDELIAGLFLSGNGNRNGNGNGNRKGNGNGNGNGRSVTAALEDTRRTLSSNPERPLDPSSPAESTKDRAGVRVS